MNEQMVYMTPELEEMSGEVRGLANPYDSHLCSLSETYFLCGLMSKRFGVRNLLPDRYIDIRKPGALVLARSNCLWRATRSWRVEDPVLLTKLHHQNVALVLRPSSMAGLLVSGLKPVEGVGWGVMRATPERLVEQYPIEEGLKNYLYSWMGIRPTGFEWGAQRHAIALAGDLNERPSVDSILRLVWDVFGVSVASDDLSYRIRLPD